MSRYNYSRLFIIADDFTGANDTGVQLTKKGAHVDVYFDWNSDYTTSQSDAIVINTDSRALTKEKAQARIKTLVAKNPRDVMIYKKIDSTLRGNIGYEIATLLQETDYQIALIIPAFPDMARKVMNGVCYVNGVELTKTEFASDPKTPIYSSKIIDCLAQQTDLKSTEIGTDIIKNNKLSDEIDSNIKQGIKLFIIDTETNEDLSRIATQIGQLKHKALLVGSAGLMNYLPTNSISTSSSTLSPDNKKQLLVIAGSMSQITQKQIEHALTFTKLWQVIDIDIDDLFPQFTDEKLYHYYQQIEQGLLQQKNSIVRTCKNDEQRHQVEFYCQKYHLTRKELGEYICQCLGKIVQHTSVKNLFLTGGDVAIAIAKSLGATGFHIVGEVTPGVPYGRLIGKIQKNYQIFTKAGGFGEQNIFTKSLEFI
ncbi:D-threonate kinase [Orbus mooreae]|uniref:D-threonate kinase n=1 Tax=Orbus mooreae TaxID=3074107 RepID=UPI00370D1FE5